MNLRDGLRLLLLVSLPIGGLLSCSFLFDFDKPLRMPDGGASFCQADEDCDDGLDCTEHLCDDGLCALAPDGDQRDKDGDGFVDEGCGGDDCDDGDREVRPDQAEECNGVDDDCDGEVDDDVFGIGASRGGILGTCGRPALALAGPSAALVCELEGSECVDGLGTERCVTFGRLSLEGDLVSGHPVASVYGRDASRPAVAYSDTEEGYGITWTDQRQVHFAFVGGDGVLGAGSPMQVTGPDPAVRESPAIAWTGSRFALAWSEERAEAPGEHGIVTALVVASASGAALDGVLASIDSAGDSTEPAVAAAGDGVVVAWTEGDGAGATSVTASLVTDGAEAARLTPVGDGQAGAPALAPHGRDGLVLAYRDVPEDQRAGEIFALFLTVGEGVLEGTTPLRVTTAPGESGAPAVAVSPSAGAFVGVAWHDERSGERQTLLARLSAEGELLDTGFPLSAGSGRADFPALVAVGASEFLAAFLEHGGGASEASTASVGCLP